MTYSLSKSWGLLGCLLTLAGCSAEPADSEHSEPPLAAYDPSYLDTTAEPCTDFYQFACGTWLAQHTPDPGYTNSRLGVSDERNSVYFRSRVEAMSSQDPSLLVAQNYYRSCLRAHPATASTAPPLRLLLAEVTALGSLADLPVLLADLHEIGVLALFRAETDIDVGDPSHHTLEIAESGWSLPARASYDDSALSLAYQTHMASLAKAAASDFALDIDPEAVVEFEHAVARAGSDDRAPEARYNPANPAMLAAALPGFDWARYFELRGFSVQYVNLYEPKALPALNALLSSAPLTSVKQYLTWRVLEAYASSISKPLIAEEFAFHRGVVDGAEQAPADEYDCFNSVREVFGFVLARGFVEAFVPNTLKPKASALVDQLERAMRENLARVSWLDEPTRVQAQAKLELLRAKVAYPEPWPETTLDLDSSQSYLEQRISLARIRARAERNALYQSVDRNEFWASPDITNAFYTDGRNDITIPVAILSDPFFREDRPPEFNFGILGSLVGHELTHAFDSRGRHFDGQGALVDWWSEPSAAEFEHRSQCLVDQFNGYEALPGLNVDGQATLDENIADLGGLIVSFAAFRALPKHATAASPFSAEQQFFLARAQAWCESASPGITARQLQSDPHAPNKFRINGSLRNLPEFAEAFACPAGSELAPTERCQIW